jgi:hypothetical protein
MVRESIKVRLPHLRNDMRNALQLSVDAVRAMNHWIETDKGEWFNLAHAQSVQEPPKQGSHGTYPIAITMADGKRHTTNSDRVAAIDLHALLAPLLPAAPGAAADRRLAPGAPRC